MSCSRRSSTAMSKEGASRGAALAGFDGFAEAEVVAAAIGSRCVAEGVRTWMWMMGEAGCEGIVIQSTRSRTARIARAFSCSVLRIEGELRRMLMPSDAETARRAGRAAEKINELPLIR